MWCYIVFIAIKLFDIIYVLLFCTLVFYLHLHPCEGVIFWSCHVGSGTRTWVLCESRCSFWPRWLCPAQPSATTLIARFYAADLEVSSFLLPTPAQVCWDLQGQKWHSSCLQGALVKDYTRFWGKKEEEIIVMPLICSFTFEIKLKTLLSTHGNHYTKSKVPHTVHLVCRGPPCIIATGKAELHFLLVFLFNLAWKFP